MVYVCMDIAVELLQSHEEHDGWAPPKLRQDTRTDYNNGGQDKILIPQLHPSGLRLFYYQRHLERKVMLAGS